jgi:K+-sensing histidine kinase KdpD
MEGLLQLIDSEYPEISDNQYVEKLQHTIKKFSHINQQISKIGEIKSYSPIFQKIQLNFHLEAFLTENFPNEIFDLTFPKEIEINSDLELFNIGLKPIIDNAAFYGQFTKFPFKEIKIYTEETAENIILNIKDNGPGISDEQMGKIIEMFYIGNTNSEGNGLGLFISKIAFEKLNIKLNFKVEENKFTIVQLIMNK